MYAINKAKIFLCNIYDNEMIFLNSDNSFNTVKISDDVVVYKGNTPISLNDINSNYIDTNCYYIVDRETTTIKYINVTR